MTHRIPHGLPHDVARDATRHALESYRARFTGFHPEGEWLDPDHARLSFSALGRRLDGEVRVDAEAVELELDVPLLMRPFQNKAMEVIEDEVRRWIERAREGRLGENSAEE